MGKNKNKNKKAPPKPQIEEPKVVELPSDDEEETKNESSIGIVLEIYTCHNADFVV